MRAATLTLAGAVLASLVQTAAAEPVRLRSGTYAVEVRLELPHLDDASTKKTVTLCLNGEGEAAPFQVLSDNNPLSRCPISNSRREDDTLSFDIVCQGRNQSVGSARFVLGPERFQGHIAMRMGGKNMTMTEVQSGHRTGDCTGEPPS